MPEEKVPVAADRAQLPLEGAHVAALWEHPQLCLAIFGVQYHTPEGQRLYEESGINDEMFSSLSGGPEGLLLNRPLMSTEGPVLMQYWRSEEDLNRYARTMPHTAWWKWLVQNAGKDVSFYHEVYRARTAEAIFEKGCTPIGPALFCSLIPTKTGEGQSRQRQERFAAAQDITAST